MIFESDKAASAERDPRIRERLAPVAVRWASSAEVRAAAARCIGVTSGQAVVHTPEAPCVLASGSGVLVDYGREIHGGIRVVSGNNRPRVVRLRVRFGESVSEAMGEPNNDHAMHDMIVEIPWFGTRDIGQTGFRFVRIDVLGEDDVFELRAIPAVALYRDLEYRGSFQSSDERLNRIWATGAYTVHLNMQEYVWDGIKRDRLVWLGDMHPEVRVICSVFDDDGVVPASLDLARDTTPLPGYINGISSYSLWWIIIQWEWYLHQGNMDYLKAQKDYLRGLLVQLAACVDEEGVEHLPEGRFLDWPSSEDEVAKHAGLQGLLAWAFEAGAKLCRALEDAAGVRLCEDAVTALRRHCPDPGFSKQAAAMEVLGGLADPAAANAAVLARRPLSGVSTFYGFYVLQARALAGDIAGCLDVIRTYWGGMLDAGATTFWEDFDLSWTEGATRIDELPVPGKSDIHADFGKYCYKGLRHSLCHGWAGGPTAWLSETVLGFKVLAPGCARIGMNPRLGDLEWAEGTFPTPYGIISVHHEKDSHGGIMTEIDSPAEIDMVHVDDLDSPVG